MSNNLMIFGSSRKSQAKFCRSAEKGHVWKESDYEPGEEGVGSRQYFAR